MKSSLLVRFKEFIAGFSKKPWACFETTGPAEDGSVGFMISCNKAFITQLQRLGYTGINDEETAQIFFMSIQTSPADINPAELPLLSTDSNIIKR